MIRRTLSILSCVMLAGAALAADGVMFSHKFDAGASHRYRMRVNSDMDMAGMEMTQMADMEVTIKCVAVTEGKCAMTMTFDKVESSNVIAGNMQSDPAAAKMVGQTVSFNADIHGDVTDIVPASSFADWADVQKIVEPVIRNWYVYLPGTAVVAGGEWKRENHREVSGSGAEYVSNEHFKFREMKKEKSGDCAAVDQTVETTIGGSTMTPMGKVTLSGTGKGKAEFSYNPATGVIVHLKSSMEMNIDMAPDAGGDAMKTAVSNHVERELLE